MMPDQIKYEWVFFGNGVKAHAVPSVMLERGDVVAFCRIGGPDWRLSHLDTEKCKRCVLALERRTKQ